MACVHSGTDRGSTLVRRSNGMPLPGGRVVSTNQLHTSNLCTAGLTRCLAHIVLHHLSGLPKDITLDGELWMARGTFDQTSQICRTTVRLGRLRTFTHFLERDSMERQWLREQVGGRIASQDRLRDAPLALSRLPVSASDLRGARADEAATASGSNWKALKRSVLLASKNDSRRKRAKRVSNSRVAVASSFMRALFGRSSVDVSRSLPVHRKALRPSRVKCCPRCGKVVKRTRTSAKHSAKLQRANADQLVSEPPLPSVHTTSTRAPNASLSRRPHIYSTLDTLKSGLSGRPIPSAYTHVCRQKSKSSNEWNRIKFMVSVHSLATSLKRRHLTRSLIVCPTRSSTPPRWAPNQ